MKSIEELRLEINGIDEALTKLLEKRMEAAGQVGEYKKATGMKIFDPVREAEVIERNASRVEKEELKPYIAEMFRQIMNVSKEYQKVILGESNE